MISVEALYADTSEPFGITHRVPMWLLPFWRRRRCPKGAHCWDEVWGGSEPGNRHYLVCDACQLMVHVASIETTFADWRGWRH